MGGGGERETSRALKCNRSSSLPSFILYDNALTSINYVGQYTKVYWNFNDAMFVL